MFYGQVVDTWAQSGSGQTAAPVHGSDQRVTPAVGRPDQGSAPEFPRTHRPCIVQPLSLIRFARSFSAGWCVLVDRQEPSCPPPLQPPVSMPKTASRSSPRVVRREVGGGGPGDRWLSSECGVGSTIV